MAHSISTYDLTTIHELLTAAFGAGDLRRFCQGHHLFRPILTEFGSNYNLNQMADKVIDYCETYLLLDELLAAVEERNPRQYARFADRLRTPASPPHAPPSLPGPLRPAAKRETHPPLPETDSLTFKLFLRKPIVWLAIAALILSGGYWLFIHEQPASVARVALRTAHNRYATAMGADRDWEIVAETDVTDNYEKFTLLCQDSGKAALLTWHKTEEERTGTSQLWVLTGTGCSERKQM